MSDLESFFARKIEFLKGRERATREKEELERQRQTEEADRKLSEINGVLESVNTRLATIVGPSNPKIGEQVFGVFNPTTPQDPGFTVFESEARATKTGGFEVSMIKEEIPRTHRTVCFSISYTPESQVTEIILSRSDEIIEYLQRINKDDKLIEILAHIIVKHSSN